jgi:hypothetical protein
MAKARAMVLAGLAAVSIGSTLFGVRLLLAFDHTPGAVNSVPAKWPASSGIERGADKPTLLVFVHPSCSCTVATLNELAKVSARQRPGSPVPAITVLFFRPAQSDWAATSLWKQAQELPGARAVWDDGGREAANFGVLTSGYTLLFNSRGDLLFQGGITGSRGHAGDNYGIDELLDSLDFGRPSLSRPPAFGCALQG